jgi:hypothetical protein
MQLILEQGVQWWYRRGEPIAVGLLVRMGKEINALLYGQGVLNILAALPSAGIAQLVEQRIRNA